MHLRLAKNRNVTLSVKWKKVLISVRKRINCRDVTNDVFAKNAWYFRNSLVRANYRDVKNGILNLLDTKEISSKMKSNITKLYEAFGMEKIFGRSDVIEVLGITERPASTLLGKMYSLGLTEKITGAGKGKYRFIV